MPGWTGGRQARFGREQVEGHLAELVGGFVEQGSVVVGEAARVDGHGIDERPVDEAGQRSEPLRDCGRRCEAGDVVQRERFEGRMVAARRELGGVVGAPRRGGQLTPGRVQPCVGTRDVDAEDSVEAGIPAARGAHVARGRGDVAGKRFGHCEVRERGTTEAAVRVLERTGRFAQCRGR